MVKCAVHGTEHGSNHCTIKTMFDIPVLVAKQQEQLLLKNMPWKGINARITTSLDSTPSDSTVQQRTNQLMSVVLEAVCTLMPKARLSPYTKRWWTTDLIQLCYIYIYWRNHTCSEQQAGQITSHLEETAKSAAKQYHDAIQQ